MKKYSIFQNLKFSFILLKEEQFEKFYMYSFLHIVLGVLCPLMLAAFPSYVVVRMQKREDLGVEIFILLCVIAGILFLQMVDTYANQKYEQLLFLFRNKLGNRLMKKALEIPFYLCESAECQKQFEKARRAIYEGNQTGIEMFLKQFPEICMNLLGILIYTGIIGVTSLTLVIMLFVVTLLATCVSVSIGKKDYLIQEELNGNYTRLQYLYQTTLDQRSAKDIRIYHAQKFFLEEFAFLREKVSKLQKKSATCYLIFDHVETLLSVFKDMIVYGVLIILMYKGVITIEQFILNIGIVAGFNRWMINLFKNLKEVVRNNIIVGQFQNFLQYGEVEGGGNQMVSNSINPHDLTLEHVSFRYPGAEKACIQDLNITIHSGEKLALVGINGSGKSTVVKLLLGLYTPSEGRILLDGVDIQLIESKSYLQEFAVEFQETVVFATSIAENVTGVSEEAQDKLKLQEKLMISGLWKFIQTLPYKEWTSITKELDPEGINFSGGEIQKLMLARTLYKDSPIIILDEPTAALDPIAENKLYQKYSMLTKGKTSVFISHRLSSTRFCDRILFFKNGKVLEMGTHEELIRRNGKYAKMYETQAKYYQKEELDHACSVEKT